MASAVTQEYGAGINFVAVQSLGVYPQVMNLVALAMFVTGVLVLAKAVLFAEFSRDMPTAGSAYAWIARTLGVRIAFVSNFIWWIGLTSAMGFLAFAFGTFLGQAFVSVGSPIGAAILSPTGHVLCGLVAIWVIYAVHATGVRNYGRLVSVLFWLVVAVAVAIVAFGFVNDHATFLTRVQQQTGLVLQPPAPLPKFDLASFFGVCGLFVFAYGGISAAPVLGGESRDARSTLPRAIYLAWLVALVLFTAVTAALFHAAPWWAMIGLMHHKHAAYATAPGLVGVLAPPAVSAVLNFAVAIIVGKTLAPQIMCASRMAFAWGRDGLFPDRLAQTNDRKSPTAALALVCMLGSVFLLESAYIGWSLGVVVRSLSVLLIWLLVAAGALNLRFNARFSSIVWCARLRGSVKVLLAALASLFITVVLFKNVAISPHTPLVFQPLFQGVVMVIVAFLLLQGAQRRGTNLQKIAQNLPVE
jgi:amino acid transporter